MAQNHGESSGNDGFVIHYKYATGFKFLVHIHTFTNTKTYYTQTCDGSVSSLPAR